MMNGKDRQWYSLKNALIEHVGCSSIRSGGQEHFKAKKYSMKEQNTQKRITDVNTNLVNTTIQVCKMKTARLSYEHLIGFLSACGGDIGHIAVHADGQYQSNTFQDALFTEMGKVKELDEFFLTSWDVCRIGWI
ncbi:Hypothetical predicted protein [Paramuricea clavata]|uniref:Uncharacterized protein n=1 Tax=Paramuricea clavata TaxID=317549 RepID=A0A6S7JFR0_PARCT|nr:Hypothetical predicted protein [Paramuricea clavata]